MGIKRKIDASEIKACLAKLEKRAEERAYQWEEKRMRIEEEMEERRLERQQHSSR